MWYFVCLVIFRKGIPINVIVKAYEFLFVGWAVADNDLVCVNVFNHSFTSAT